MSAVVVLGAQWGDEGKAKVIDILAQEVYAVIRYQGGCNAGHTVVHQGETFKFHLIPSGILYPGKVCIIGPGTVILPDVLQRELISLKERAVPTKTLFISPRAHITLPHHLAIEEIREEQLGEQKIGTTKRGIGTTYEDKVGRLGLRVGDLLLPDSLLMDRLEQIADHKNPILTKAYELDALNPKLLFNECLLYREIIEPFVADTDELVAKLIKDNLPILLEGAQGTMLDLDHGTYPFVTSSNPTAGGACTGAGIGPRAIKRVIGVAKCYATRVGAGPFPTELNDNIGEQLLRVGAEYGTTTGRARRCGWFDGVALRYAVRVNGMDGLALTKLDVLSGLDEIKLCVAYENQYTKELCHTIPLHPQQMSYMKPVYETFEGWKEPLQDIRLFSDLPQAAQNYLNRLCEFISVPLTMISVGPDREQTIMQEDVFSTLQPQPTTFRS